MINKALINHENQSIRSNVCTIFFYQLPSQNEIITRSTSVEIGQGKKKHMLACHSSFVDHSNNNLTLTMPIHYWSLVKTSGH